MTLLKRFLLLATLSASVAVVVTFVRRQLVEPTWHSTPVPVPTTPDLPASTVILED